MMSLTTTNITKCDQLILAIMALSMLTSAYVSIEPAPTDILLILATCIALLLNRFYVSKQMMLGIVILLLFSIANFMSIWVAYKAEDGLNYFIITLYLMITWLGIVGFGEIYGARVAEKIMSYYAIGAGVTALFAFGVYFELIQGRSEWFLFERIKLFFKDPNVFGPYFVLPAVYMFGLLEQRRRFIYAILLVLFVGAVFISFSRAAWLNLAIAMLIYYLLPRIKKHHWRSGLTVYLGIVAVVIVIAVLKNRTLLMQFTERASIQHYDSERFASQEIAWREGVLSPLGKGPGQSDALLAIAPHNVYARIFYENGWLGLGMLIIFLLVTLYVCMRKFHSIRYGYVYRICFAVVVGHIVNGFFIDTLHWRHFWVVLALAWISLGGETDENCANDHAPRRTRGRASTFDELKYVTRK